MTGITMATNGWTWQDHCWPSCSEGMHVAMAAHYIITCLYYGRLFKNLTKEVRMFAQKYIDKGRVCCSLKVYSCRMFVPGLQLGVGHQDQNDNRRVELFPSNW